MNHPSNLSLFIGFCTFAWIVGAGVWVIVKMWREGRDG